MSLLFTIPVAAQTASVIMTVQMSGNGNSTGIVATPVRKQLGNFGTGCTSGTPTPSPAGQLWATAAIQSTFSGVGGCPVQGIPTVTSSGTGILAVDNGHGAGGTDSATAITDTYGGSSQDAVCTGDAHHNDATLFSGLSAAACVTNGTAVFGMSTAASFGNADMLFPSFYASASSTALDAATWYYDDVYFIVPSHTNLHAMENDVGIVSSPNSYLGSSKSEMVWGTQYSWTANMWQYCPQNCSAFKTFKFCLLSNLSSCVSTYALTDGDAYRVQWYGSRSSVSSTYCYNYIVVYDVTAGGTPTAYALYDNASGLVACGSPINQPTFASGAYVQNQVDMTVANASTSYDIISRTTQYFSVSGGGPGGTTSAFGFEAW